MGQRRAVERARRRWPGKESEFSSLKMAEKKPEILKAACNKCLCETNHELLARRGCSWEHEDVQGVDNYEMLLCCGCESVAFRCVSSDSQTCDQEGNSLETTVYYPPRVSRREPEWLVDLWFKQDQDDLYSLIKELYVAVHQEQRALAGIGVRTAIDMVMTAKVGDQGDFTKTLAEFQKKGFIAA